MADFDAIVVGSGMSGGWAAKELSERGLKVLVLERGNDIDPAKDYTDHLAPWEKRNTDLIPEKELEDHYYFQREPGYAVREITKHLWVRDSEHPYETPEGRPYNWLRGYHLGGRSIMWARVSLRLGPPDFEKNKLEGVGVDWPIRYADLAPWYDHVERFAGVAGFRDGVPHLPDGVFQPGFEMNAGEKWVKARLEKAYPTRPMVAARCAHLTQPTEEQTALGRGQCQVRSHCYQGCQYGAYFSAVSATLPAARNTGRCTIVTDAIVAGLDYDPETRRVSGVRVIDAKTKAARTYTAKIVFLCASAIPTAMLLLQSRSEAFPNGLANRSDQVGRNLMDHILGVGGSGRIPGLEDRYYRGRRPQGIYIPNYSNTTEPKPYLRGFGFQGGAQRGSWSGEKPGVGQALKLANRTPGEWRFRINAFGEQLPHPDNRVTLSKTTDRWGLPLARIDAIWRENDLRVMEAARADLQDMLARVGLEDVQVTPKDQPLKPPGTGIHEMGTARMGRDPATSVLNGWNQAHDVANLFVTDGACMTSAACQNPSLTYMALTARAAARAAELVNTGVL